MSDSDVESDIDEVPEEEPHRARRAYEKKIPVTTSLDIFERWKQIPVPVKRKAGYLMHMGVFWWNILLRQQDKTSVTHWAIKVGFLDAHGANDLNLKRLLRLEILESLLRALEKGCLSDDLTRCMITLGTRFDRCPASLQAECMAGAMRWLEKTGEPGIITQVQLLGSQHIRFHTVSYLFTEYAHYVHAMAYDKDDTMERLTTSNCTCCVKKSEEMKNQGNELFRRKKYNAAVKYYTKAIQYHPDNHFLYGNRALCFLNREKYQKAIWDGKRATIIKPDWAKGHYHFCEALFALGEHRRALGANERALGLCRGEAEDIRVLQQQRDRFLNDIQERRSGAKRKKNAAKKDLSKRVESVPRGGAESTHTTEPTRRTAHTRNSSTPENKEQEDRRGPGSFPVTVEGGIQTERNSKETKETKSEMSGKKTSKMEACTPEKSRATAQHPPPQEKKRVAGGADLRSKLKCAVEDAHTALSDQRCRNAEQAFAQALSLLESTTPKELGISELDVVVLKYGHAIALLETGQPEELIQAKDEFEKIQKIADRSFQCLVFYGVGKVCLKENRFSAALEEFSKSMQMINLKITPGKLTWPTTKVIVEETRVEHFKARLVTYIEMCKFPPKPDAVCHHGKCLGHSKTQIYFTDPDFKGFIRMICCQRCNVEFHISCWKKMKSAVFSDKNDKDFLQEICFTPDCGSKICRIVIFGPTGLIKCEFESAINKNTVTAKPRVKQICTSLKKLKSKEDRKLRRKRHQQMASQARQEKSESVPLEKSVTSGVEKIQENASQSWLFYGDQVLHQIFENKELLKEDTHDVSAFMKCIHPWREREKGKADSVQCLKEPETMQELVDMLLERKNRVWSRIFIQYLSSLDINPKLRSWACRLDHAGLQASETFIERYAQHLEEVDLAPLLAFGPMQDALIEKFGTVPEIFSEGFTVTDYLKQAPPQEMRLFIWTLEEHRELYPSFQHALNEYFELMDSLCLVIKKTEHENQINSPVRSKNKSRKKKQKEPKQSVIVLSGTRGGVLWEEDDEDVLSEEDSLVLLDTSDPFMVPEHIRNQVAEFEGRYSNVVPGSHYRRILDNNPDSIKESLYDYFEQILEAHGPMEAHDQLLVGELENFPAEAQLKIQEAGGLEPFLLESLRFVMTDNLIGLMKHAVSLQEEADDLDHFLTHSEDGSPSRRTSLNPSAKEFQPLFQNPVQDNGDASASFEPMVPLSVNGSMDKTQQECFGLASNPLFTVSEMPDMYSACLDPFKTLKPLNIEPLNIDFASDVNDLYSDERKVFPDSPDSYLGIYLTESGCSRDDLTEPAVEMEDTAQFNSGAESLPQPGTGPHSRVTADKMVDAHVRLDQRDDVAVNTEPYEPFETNKGDMIKKEKDNAEFERQMHQMKEDYKEEEQRRKEEISALEAELESIQVNTEIINKELELFQQKLEAEVKKDQQEKKENQETLKALKSEIKELSESNETITRSIREGNKEYEKCLSGFLERSNQWAAEKMSLEEQIKRYRDLSAEASRRVQAAEISNLENRRRRGLRGLRKCVSDGEVILAKIKEMVASFPSAEFQSAAENWQAFLQDTKEKALQSETQYKEQMELLQKGSRLCALPLVAIPSTAPPPALPAIPMMPPVINDPSVVQVVYPVGPAHQPFIPRGVQLPMRPQLRGPCLAAPVLPESSLGKPGQQPDRVAQASPPAPQVRPAVSPLLRAPRGSLQQHSNVFEKIVDRLSCMFPHYSRPTLTKFIQEVRAANGGCLNSLSYEEVINRVAQLILDHQDNAREHMSSAHRADPGAYGAQVCRTPPPRSDSPATGHASNTPPPSHVWKSVGTPNSKWGSSKALNVEDPCIICHEEMDQDELCVLECRHSFHRECIKSWLKEQSTCPTCREHALLPEDFPLLPGRIRRGPTPAAPSS